MKRINRTLYCGMAVLCVVSLTSASLAAAESETPTFTEDVAPILMDKCVTCHRPNDVAPMSLLTYDEARPWAKSIRQAVAAGDMPPWDADPRYGDFANDISLDPDEVQTILRWVDQGAAQGDPAHMPPPPDLPPAGSWRMGREPDYVIDLASIDVAADGPDLFITQVFSMEDLPENKWVQAIELLPGNTEVLHHVVTYLGPFGMSDDDEESNAGVNKVIYLNEAAKRPIGAAEAPSIGGVWVAGSPPTVFPQGTGHPLKTPQMVTFNMHYHPSGNAGADASKAGFYLGEGELQKEITTAFAADPGMWIPAGAANHQEHARYLFSQDSEILSLLPHMHNRGKSMRYTLTTPDGEDRILLDVPEYDYDWQNIYRFSEPVHAPAGSLLSVEAVWDNSKNNPANPDPTINVPWGDGTNNEMLVAFVDYVVTEGTKPKAVAVNQKIDKLLALHDADEAYSVTVDGMGFGGNWGLVLPEEGEGTFYMVLGSLMFSTSVPEIVHGEEETLYNAGIITSGGGTRLPLGFLIRQADGGIEGEVFFGRKITPEAVDSMRGSGRPFTGRHPDAAVSTTSTAGAAD